MKRLSAIIIGAGYGGMALANLLARDGYRVDVYEKNSHPGGRIAATKKDGYTFDLGPSWYLMPEVFERYYNLLGKSAARRLNIVRFSPGYKVFFENHAPVYIQGDVDKDKHVFESIEPGAGKRLEHYVNTSTAAYDLALRHFLYTDRFRVRDMLHADIMRQAWRMLGMTLVPLHRYVSRRFHDQRLHQLLEYHSVFLGASPFQAPAVYSLMSHLDYRSGVYYPRRGMMTLVDDMQRLGGEYNVSYHLDSPVANILVRGSHAYGVKLEDGSEHRADIIISNADLHHTETKLLESEHQSFPERYWQKRQPGPGALLISLGVSGELPQLEHHNLYFVDKWRENFDDIYRNAKIPEHASLYVCNPTKTDRSLAPKGCENLFILMPIPAGVSLTAQVQKTVVDRVIAQLAKAIDQPDLLERIATQHVFGPHEFGDNYNAWQYNAFGGESHLLRQSILFRTPNKSRRLNNLYYVGAGTVPGIGLPMCLIGAEVVHGRILRERAES
ncbi:phytoene dehydrogenase [Candidatus Saccharibacteria bacterium]|nr:MAG: phytoene dehydrogenase [Candidatus Saccharibacteria bacterium]